MRSERQTGGGEEEMKLRQELKEDRKTKGRQEEDRKSQKGKTRSSENKKK